MESSELIGDDDDDNEIFIIKQEPTNLIEEEDCQGLVLEQCTTNSQKLPLFVRENNTSSLLTSCIACHELFTNHQNHGLESRRTQDEDIMQTRTAFFKQLIHSQINSTKDSKRKDFAIGFFCDSCSLKIDHLNSLHNQLIKLQGEFEQLKTELVQVFVQETGNGAGVSSCRTSSRISNRISQANYNESEEFKNDDDDDWNNSNVENSESTCCSDSDDDKNENEALIKAQQLKSCYVELEKIGATSHKRARPRTNNTIKPKEKRIRSSNTTTTNKVKSPKAQETTDVEPPTTFTEIPTSTSASPLSVCPKHPYQCHICSKTFTTGFKLKIHLRTHTGEKPFVCENCAKGFTNLQALKKHILVLHSGFKNFICEVCNKPFSHRKYLRNHFNRVHGHFSWVCPKCPLRNFLNRDELEKHVEICCGDKSKAFPQNLDEEDPSTTVNPGEIERLHQQALIDARTCRDCGLTFEKVVLLKVHCRSEVHGEARKNQCQFCGKCFTLNDSLKKHILQVHEGVKKYPCSHCSESFPTRYHLRRHTTIHTGLAAFKCTYCEESYTRNISLRKHLVQSHAEEVLTKPNKTFVCGVCWQNFELESQLKGHQTTAHFTCDVCKKVLISAKGLRVHSIIHTGEKPFQCKHCGNGFNHAFNLAEHERTHTGEKRYQCSGCADGFVRKKYLEAHVQKFHPGLWSAQLEEQQQRKGGYQKPINIS